MERKVLNLLIYGFLTTLSCSELDATAAQLKLTGGDTTSSSSYGILQVYHNGQWGTVCDDEWDVKDTKVACGQLGFTEGTTIKLTSNETGKIWLDDVACNGSESSLDECGHPGWNVENCGHSEDVGILCHYNYSEPWTTSGVRLAGGSTPNEGRVEIQMYGGWGTVCNTKWDTLDANVVCRMMNYSGAIIASQRFGDGTGLIWVTELRCKGDEKNILNCTRSGLGKTSSCSHKSDAGAVCQPNSDSNIAVRLVNGSSPNQGRVEVRYYGVWGTVCDDDWGLEDAYVVCRMLNYSKASWAGTARVRGRGLILLDDVGCHGYETSLENCSHKGWDRDNCFHSEDAGVMCRNATKEESSIAVRLVGGQKHFGRVEIKYNGTWLPICDDTWDIQDARVICRMLGYQGGLAGIKTFGVGTPGLWMGGVECSGEEVSISECYHRGWSNTQCPGYYYAGVMCKTSKEIPPVTVRLEDGSVPTSGRVAVHYGNVWGTICNDGLGIRDAKVICRMLGYVEALKVHPKNTFKPGNGTIWLSNLGCNGTESSIVDCRHSKWGETTCNHDNEVAVMCKTADLPQFYINGTSAITDTTAVVLFDDMEPIDTRFESVFQVAVEKKVNEQRLQSYDPTIPLAFDELNVTMATKIGDKAYITAEILGPSLVPNLTIGDGQYYNGYFNAPLEPGCNYRVYVRVVTKSTNKEKTYGNSMLVDFSTVVKGSALYKTTVDQPKESLLIGLSVLIVILIGVNIGCFVWFKRRTKTTNEQTEMSEMRTSMRRPGNEADELQCSTTHLDKDDDSSYEEVEETSQYRYQPKIPGAKVTKNVYQMEESFYENVAR